MHTKTIGEAAGKLWKTLGEKEKISLAQLSKVVEDDSALAHQALGWLAREGKIEFETKGKVVSVKLTAHEQDAFKRHHATNGHAKV